MGWSSGSVLFSDVITALKKHVKDAKVREKVYPTLIDAFEHYDCDTLYECQGEDDAFDKVWAKKYPDEED